MIHHQKNPLLLSLKALTVLLLLISYVSQALPTSELHLAAQLEVNNERIPNGLNQSEWQNIKQQVALSKYHAKEINKGNFTSRNSANDWSIRFNKNGQTHLSAFNPASDDFSIALKLESFNREGKIKFTQPQKIQSEKSKLTYHWNDNVQEFWINSPQQLEQWFIIDQKPLLENNKNPLVVEMSLHTNLPVSLKGNTLNFSNKINYNKLKVWDSNETIIPAKMQYENNKLSLVIDDSQAHYPLTIDPSFQNQDYVKAINAGSEDLFGTSVSLSGDTLVVGAPREDSGSGNPFVNNSTSAGAAYVFIRDDQGQWNHQAYLKPTIIDAGDTFGFSVSVFEDTIVIGAPDEGSDATGVNADSANNAALGSGAAYVFTRSGSTWTQVAYLKASNTEGGLGGGTLGDSFGTSVAISGTVIAVGAPDEDSNATAVNGNDNNNSFSNSGAAYVFELTNGNWSQTAYLKADNTGSGDRFGRSIAMDQNNIVVGAPNEDSNSTNVDGDGGNNSNSSAGAAYVFNRSIFVGSDWSLVAYLKASNTGNGDLFGSSVAIDFSTIVVGAPSEDSNSNGVNGDGTNNSASSSGAAYVFKNLSVSGWSPIAYLKASNSELLDQFGQSVSISGNRIIVGAFSEDSIATGVDGDQLIESGVGSSGAAYVFSHNASNIWSQVSYLKSSNTGDLDNFGRAVVISGDYIAVGAPSEDGDGSANNNNNAENAGAAYVFNATDQLWEQQRITKSFNIDLGDRFGHAIAMNDSTLVVSAFLEDGGSTGVNGDESDNSISDSGAVYIFVRGATGQWEHQAYLKASNTGANDWFGYSVAISGNTVVVGARNESSNATGVQGNEGNDSLNNAGAVYVFTRDLDTWSQQAYIKASNTNADDLFGFSVGISGDTLVVGAVFEDSDTTGIDGNDSNNDAINAGAAYVYVRDGNNNWSQQSYLKAFNTDIRDEFGRDVAIAGDLIVVSANREDSDSTGVNASDNNNSDNVGAVYAFTRSNNSWSQDAYIKAPNAGQGDEFGRSIALSESGEKLVVGARHEDSNSPFDPSDNSAADSGAVYVFRKLTNWASFGYIKADNLESGDWFGNWVAIADGEFLPDSAILVGANRESSESINLNSGENNNSLSQAGAAYLFIGNIVGDWQQQTYFKASNSGLDDGFGSSVALSKNSIVVGASLEDSSTPVFNNDSSESSGAIYIFNTTNDVIFMDGFE